MNRSKISEAIFRQLTKLFCLDLDANQIAELTGLNRNTINRYLKGIRQQIAEYCEQTSLMSGQIEVDESFFGAKRPGNVTVVWQGKTTVFGLLKRNGKVHTEIVPDYDVKRYKLLFVVTFQLTRLSIPTGGVVMKDWWMLITKSTSA